MGYYHGTPVQFRYFDLSKAAEYKDFGRGIYLSEEYWHAESVAVKKNAEHAYVMKYEFNIEELRKVLKVKEFRKTSIPWVKFVLLNRNKIVEPEYDIVIGATADAMAQVLIENFYKRHRHREASIKEYKELISRLSVNKYPNQICITSQKGIDYINRKYVATKIIY